MRRKGLSQKFGQTRSLSPFPFVSTGIAVLITVIYGCDRFLQKALLIEPSPVVGALGFVPGSGPWWSLWTASLVHAHLAHLIGNLIFFLLMAPKIEKEMKSCLFLSLLLIVVPLVLWLQGWFLVDVLREGVAAPLIGSSIVVAFVLGAFWVRFPRFFIRTTRMKGEDELEGAVISLPVGTLVGLWVLVQVLLGIFQLAGHPVTSQPIAHLGGFGLGSLVGLILRFPLRHRLELMDREALQLWSRHWRQRAVQLLQQRIQIQPEPYPCLLLSLWCLQIEDLKAADEAMRTAIHLEPWDRPVHEIARSLLAVPACVRLPPNTLGALACRLETAGHYDEADRLFYFLGSLTDYDSAKEALLRSARLREKMARTHEAHLQMHKFWFFHRFRRHPVTAPASFVGFHNRR
ncbi:MAG: rhomboid family intramembrane serine protease [Armatimonadetes bacterium]|nr:rhomboid family intramembrane serine protease [Armatimonadota bacterium]MDW8122305.1 rhomboid family intramembrane serine protease [Armatimonadota bacterium]